MQFKRLGNGLLIVGSVAAIWKLARIVALASYSKKGPFINSSAPGIDSTFLNGLEGYLNAGVAKSGVPIGSWFGPYSVTTTPTLFNHNLHDATGANITPDIVLPNVSGTSITTHCVEWDPATITSTQVKLTSDGGTLTVYGIALKF